MVKTKILAFCLQEIPSATVGVNTSFEVLQNEGLVDFRFKETLSVNEEDIAWADVIISIRGCECLELEIMREGKRLNKYLIYFLDDDLLNIPQNSASTLYYSMSHIRSNIIEIMKLSNYLWTTNKNIAMKYGHYTELTNVINAPSLLLEGTLNFQEYNNDSRIVIGFSGSIDHGYFLNDFLKHIVFSILELYPNVCFEFFGAKPDFVGVERIRHIPYANNYDEYKEIMRTRKWDIGLAPLPLSEFHSCKYYNKYLEYGAIGTPGIYSNVEPYVFIVENEKNGILVNNTHDEWIRAISTLIENRNLKKKIVEASHTQLCSFFTVDKIAEEIASKIPLIISYQAPKCSTSDVKLKKESKNVYMFKMKQLFKTHGIKGFYIILKKMIEKTKLR